MMFGWVLNLAIFRASSRKRSFPLLHSFPLFPEYMIISFSPGTRFTIPAG